MDETIDYRKKLDEYLLGKLAQQNDPNYGAEDREQMASIRKNDRQNALAAALMKSAAQVGTIGGKAADASPVADMADRLAQVNRQRLGDIGDRRAQADKQYQMNADVYRYLADKQQKQEQATAEDKYRKDTLSQKEREMQAKAEREKAEAEEKQRQWNADHSLSRERLAAEREKNQGDLAAKRAKEDQDRKEKEVTANKQNVEVDARFNNLKSNIEKAKRLISENGTFELTGPHNSALQQIIQDLAVDYAKLGDPNSAALPGEVEAAKGMLPIQGLGVKNDTAVGSLDQFLDQVETRYNSRRSAQGMDTVAKTKPVEPGTAIAGQDKVDAKIAEYAKANGIPYGKAQAILEKRGYKPNEQ